METVTDLIFLGAKITADADCSHEIKRCLHRGRKAMTNLDSILKSKDIANKDPSSQSYGFSSSYVWMWELDHKVESRRKDWCFWTVLEKTLENPLDSKEILMKSVNPNESHIFNLYAEYIMRNAGLESRLLGEISRTSDMLMILPSWQKVKRI